MAKPRGEREIYFYSGTANLANATVRAASAGQKIIILSLEFIDGGEKTAIDLETASVSLMLLTIPTTGVLRTGILLSEDFDSGNGPVMVENEALTVTTTGGTTTDFMLRIVTDVFDVSNPETWAGS
jgi:hypothetical protein